MILLNAAGTVGRGANAISKLKRSPQCTRRMSKKKKDYSGFLGWHHKQCDEIVAAVNSRTRKKLLEDKAYRAKILAYIKQIDREERWEYCKENDLNPMTMQPYQHCQACGRKTEYSCDCTDDRW